MADPAPTNDPRLLLMISLASGPKHGHAMLIDIADFAGVRLGPGHAVRGAEPSGGGRPRRPAAQRGPAATRTG